MEKYEGIKFNTRRTSETFSYDSRLPELHDWVNILGELGLAPVHAEGAYGNHSYRCSQTAFIITRTGMKPGQDMHAEDYCMISYAEDVDEFLVKGKYDPSSESFLHYAIYDRFPEVQAIMHGHSSLLNRFARELGIAETTKEYPYGTKELGHSALEVLCQDVSFIMLKNHGFVATGPDIQTTARRVLHSYGRLLQRLPSLVELR
ncbi:MAG: class II aldolase/adducin family protein [Desulfocapsaceae bacterium]|nr:class II aldolase/adducin family protein [Desulfocapsaceae bacterium]